MLSYVSSASTVTLYGDLGRIPAKEVNISGNPSQGLSLVVQAVVARQLWAFTAEKTCNNVSWPVLRPLRPGHDVHERVCVNISLHSIRKPSSPMGIQALSPNITSSEMTQLALSSEDTSLWWGCLLKLALRFR